MATPWIAFASVSTWLLLLQVGQTDLKQKPGNKPKPQKANIAQEPANDSKPLNANQDPNAVAQNDEQDTPITANAGKFIIQVTKSDAIDQMTLGRKPSSNRAANLLLEQLQNGSAQNTTNNFQKNEQFSGGNGNGSGSAGGISGGFTSGSSSSFGSVTSGSNGGFVRPNIAVAFKVDPNDKGIFELENMQAIDDRGNPVPWMAPGPFNFYDPSFEEGLDGEIIAYFQEENDTEHLTISRELKVTPGRRIEVEFPDDKPA